MLITAAANDWGATARDCKTDNGIVTHASGKRATYGQLVAKAAGKEPVEFRRSLLTNHPRHLAVLNAAVAKAGKVEQQNFHDYPVLRMHQAPLVETVIIPSAEPPEGMGEPGTPPVAPAVANAVYALTGTRLRRLPLRLGALA